MPVQSAYQKRKKTPACKAERGFNDNLKVDQAR